MNEILALVLTLVIHEAGHAIVSLLCGAPVLGIRTRAGGLSLLCRADSLSYPRAALVYAGGAAANLLTAVLFSRVSPLAAYSVGAAIFNLLPLPGSDGEMLCSSLLSLLTDSPDMAARAAGTISNVVIFLFWMLAMYLCLVGVGDIMILAFAVAMVIYRLSEWEK